MPCCRWRASRCRSFPSGQWQAPFFDGALKSVLTIPDDPRLFATLRQRADRVSLAVPSRAQQCERGRRARRVRPLHRKGGGGVGRRRVGAQGCSDQLNKTRHSRLSFYTFNLGSPRGQGNGSYMEYGVSKNDGTPIELGQWVFVVGEAEPWISPSDLSTGCALWKQGVAAKRELADKYGDFGVHPQQGSGSITVGGSQETGFQGAIAHLAIWNRLLSGDDIASIWSARRERPRHLRNVPQLHLRGWVEERRKGPPNGGRPSRSRE